MGDMVGTKRLYAARNEMLRRAQAARESWDRDFPDSRASAALRGKARGYSESAEILDVILRGGWFRRKWRSTRAQRGDLNG
jgi:DsbC/DsbD-like thiol-disulfide interchange protein